MSPWQIWLIIAGVCFILEIATVGFLIFWFALAALITAFLSLFIKSIVAQTAIFVVLSAAFIFLTRPLAKKLNKKDNIVTNANSIIGKEATVIKEINSNSIGQVKIGGDVWSAICNYQDVTIPVGSQVSISRIDGVKVIVEPISFETVAKV